MPRPTAIVLMSGFSGADDIFHLVQDARTAAAEDLLARAQTGAWDRFILCSNRPDAIAPDQTGLERLANSTHPFHFGRELQNLVQHCELEEFGVLYVGGGLPLLSGPTLELIRTSLAAGDGVAITNNLHSCDFIGWPAGGDILRILPPDTDNDLAWQLRRAGIQIQELPRAAETIFDIDTPTDLLLLSLAQGLGPHMSALLERAPLDRSGVEAVLKSLRSFEDTALCYGRISHYAWAHFASLAACQTRIISEERGMRASGRLARGEVRSLLGFLADQAGFPAMFDTLARLSDSIIMDSRVLMAHCRQWPRAEDRFHSDLGQVEAIEDPWLRDMTRAAQQCGIPVLLGGHCLVSGGLYLLGDAVGPKEYPWP